MDRLKRLVLSNGTLNSGKIYKSEKLYQGMNGKFVERFYLSPTESFIFKPLTNNEQLGKEVWVYKYVLPSFPEIYPKLLAHSVAPELDENWMIFEDLGSLRHDFREETVLEVVRLMGGWHSLSVEGMVGLPVTGLKPKMEDIVLELTEKKVLVQGLGMGEIFPLLDRVNFSKRLVLSHGDLHIGNIARAGEKVVVLDWEHTHLNVPYWDLYHLLDLAHPIFPKQVPHPFRELALKTYCEHAGIADDAFIREYYLFSAAFSIWMLLLIRSDLDSGQKKWPREQLEEQFEETLATLRDCIGALLK
ncbi:phosphotransferase [Neobacillus cucumis]|uniref:phosphotransferase n=1 Tax=Neobacillus cucumis TaxID=1740721 RepID=UPI0018E04D02|nr:phosphotransferase [Neobacillus cucumis]MBI0578214.1 phosphotransferase [Neobacillus cucumis]